MDARTSRHSSAKQSRNDNIMTSEEGHVPQLDSSESTRDVTSAQITVEQWLEIRKEAGLRIDPETAKVRWEYALTLDPYGVYPDLPAECRDVGRQYFACAPGSDIWVSFYDLPQATPDALWRKHG
jgi:hypothetical protein